MKIETLVFLAFLAVIGAGVIFGKNREEADLRAVLQGWEACGEAVATDAVTESVERLCPAAIAEDVTGSRRTAACDQALLEADLFAVRATCSTEVKTLLGQRDAETNRADSLAEVLSRTRADQAAAIARAETRARTEAERSARARTVIEGAPRGPDGLVDCDAGCLRDLAGA